MKIPGKMLLFLLITQIAGCAFGTRYVHLTYPPDHDIAYEKLESSAPNELVPVSVNILLEVRDARPDGSPVGNIRNTVGMDTASAISDDNVVIWVQDAITMELAQLGYEVADHRYSDAGASGYALTTDITKIYCDVYAMYDGEVTLNATLTRQSGESISREFAAKVVSGMSFASSANGIEASIAEALQSAIRQMLLELGFARHSSVD